MKKIDASIFRPYTVDGFQNKGSLLEPVLLRSDIDVNPSNFHYWKLSKLLPTIPDGKRAQLSIVDIIWIEILKSMKNLGCSIHAMSLVHKILFEDSYHKNYAEFNLRRNLATFTEREKKGPLTKEELTLRENIEVTMNDPLLRSYMRWSISHLYSLVLECIEQGADINIRLFENGKAGILGHQTELQLDVDESLDQQKSFVQISLSDIVNRFFSDLEMEKKLGKVGYLSPDELMVITEMRNQNIKMLTIHFDNEEHSIKKIESNTVGLITGDKAREVRKILGLKNYAGIELNTRDGRNLSFVRTEKKFLK